MKRSLIALLVVGVCSLAALAQDKPKTTKPVTPEISLTLTQTEIANRQQVETEYRTKIDGLEAALRETQGVTTEDKALPTFWKIAAIYAAFDSARARYFTWLTDAQKAHGCIGCELKDSTFVPRPEETKKQ